MTTLRGRLEARHATVAVVGLGHVGRPLAEALAGAGFDVLGIDTDRERVDAAGVEATSDPARLRDADVVVICVPTPIDDAHRPVLAPVVDAARAVAEALRGQLVVLCSTTWPGTTREVVLPILAGGDNRCGRDFFLAYSPERLDPGRTGGLRAVPRLVGGLDEVSGDLAETLFGAVVDRVVRTATPEVAEAAKLLENVYRAVNIAMVNEMKTILTAMGIDVWEVLDAAATKPFGFQRFDPGPGMGGHCIPVDPFYLAHKARELGMPTRFIELAGEINRAIPDFVAERTVTALAERGREVAGSRVLVLGVAYKRDIADVRNSPSEPLVAALVAAGAEVDYSDPHVPVWLGRRSAPLDAERLASYDAVVVATDHAAFDYDLLARSARLVVDTRGVMRGREGAPVVTA